MRASSIHCWLVSFILSQLNQQTFSVDSNEVRLRRLLFDQRIYDQKVCPESGVTKVHINLILLQIESVDEKAQVVTSNIQLTSAWCDPYMSWNASRFNITELSVGSNYLWTPDVVLVNSADGKYSRNREHYALILRHDVFEVNFTMIKALPYLFLCLGYVRFMFQDLWKTICKVRSTYFPFDRQYCTLIIRSGAHDSQSIKFIQRRPIQGHSFIRGEWELVKSFTYITNERVSDFGQADFSLVRFVLVLRRNHVYYLIKIILPFSMVSFVTLFTFLLPPQTGEKLTLNVTILLSLVIYLQLLSAHIPKSDDETPMLTLFCNINFFFVFLSCIMTVFVLYLYHRPSKSNIVSVPNRVKIILLDYISPLVYCRFKRRQNSKTAERTRKDAKLKSLNSIEQNMFQILSNNPQCNRTLNKQGFELLKLLHQLKNHIRTHWAIFPVKTTDELGSSGGFHDLDYQKRLDEWQHVALVLDRIFFSLFILSMPCTAFLFVEAHSSIARDYSPNITVNNSEIADAKCHLIYKPVFN